MTDARMLGAIESSIERDGKRVANHVLTLAVGLPDIALAIIGVAAGQIIDQIDAARRREVLQEFLACFEETPE